MILLMYKNLEDKRKTDFNNLSFEFQMIASSIRLTDKSWIKNISTSIQTNPGSKIYAHQFRQIQDPTYNFN